MRGAFVLALVAASAALASCDKPAAQKPAEKPAYQTPTATEVFDLRSRCAELGDVLLTQQQASIGPALYADAKSHYNPKTNRCYVVVDVNTADLSSPNFQTTEYLYDGQTKENLAWYETKGPAHLKEDRCAEYLDMPIDRTCLQINEKIWALMADNRQQ
jgi:hypothetical protein